MSSFTTRLVLDDAKSVGFSGPADITQDTADAIVNAANSSLLGGGGVDGAIHRAGGPAILDACRQLVAKIGHLPPGQAVITTAGRLRARYVIHTVGPIHRPGNSEQGQVLASCYRESIRLAEQHQIRSLAFPSISTGAYGYPVTEAAQIAVSTVLEALKITAHLNRVRFVLFDQQTVNAYISAAEGIVGTDRSSSFKLERAS